MGCELSTDVKQPGAATSDEHSNLDFNMETRAKPRYNKATGEEQDQNGERKEVPEGDLFEAVDAGEGEQFMAVKPWLGAIKEPKSHPPANPSPPAVSYTLEYAYGYRCEDSR